ncbi:TonB-dependent receptor plug domain-containing protein [Agrilutibacter solisilvae]|nr:TonB-dependent receptor [Lysobacter solisilvae]
MAVAIRRALWGSAVMALAGTTTVYAQETTPAPAPQEEATTLDTVSVLGSRTKPRTEASSAVPIDIFDGEKFQNEPSVDMLDKMRTLVPSFVVSTIPIDDAASLVRPATLRGLPPDNTLVLVNGKRRHRAAVITFLGHGVADGAQGPDISVIPSMALEQVEVLRDGAAAQYGSDAIAGVINFGLKRSDHGGAAEAFFGQFYEGDGFTQQYGVQQGLPVTENGFLTLTAEWRSADATSRSVQRDDAAAVAAAGYPGVRDPAQIWGSPETHEDMKFVANFGLSGENIDFYGFGNYAKRDVEGGFYYRNPTTRSGVFSNDGGNTLLIGDLDTSNAVTCPTIALRDGAGNLIDYATVSAQVGALPAECFTFLSQFPGGFTPQFGGRMEDSSLVLGVKGVWGDGWHWDLSGSYGRNDIKFYMLNTINASMGPEQPGSNEFAPGGNRQTETSFNFDVGHDIETGFTHGGPIALAMGAEWRDEEFEISAGDYSSYAIGPLVDQGFSLGSNGFNGFNPRTAGAHSRDNWAVYVDAEAPFTEQFRMSAAVRYEDFSDFGGTTNWKLTGRYDFTETFALRGAISTGFRAPTPGQANAEQVTTSFINGQLRDTAVLAPTNAIAAFYGAEPLTPEESTNYSLGLVWNSGPWLATADWYLIKTEDRIALSNFFTVSDADRAALVAAGHPEAASISEVQFFVNDFDTKTSGLDVVGSYTGDHFGGHTTYSLAANWNHTEVTDRTEAIISDMRVKKLEESLPAYRGYIGVDHQREVFHANARLNWYGGFFEDHLDDGGLPIDEGSAVTVDAEIGWKFASGLYVNVGAQNLFDKVPSDNPWGGIAGAKYPVHSPYGFNGGFYYTRVGFKW